MLRAREGKKGMISEETTPPEAAATTLDTMGRSQAADNDSGVWVWRVNLWSVETSGKVGDGDRDDLHGKDHAEVDGNGEYGINPP